MSRIPSGSGYPFENVYAYSRAIGAGNHVFVSGMTARPPDLEGDASDDFADHAWAMLMARLNNDRLPKLHKEVHCTLIVRESTIKCAAKVRGGNALDARASLPAKPFGGFTEQRNREAAAW